MANIILSYVHHPVLLSTSVKFDESVIKTQSGANFEETKCFCWRTGGGASMHINGEDGVGEILCGKTGMKIVVANNCEQDGGVGKEKLEESSFSLRRYLGKQKNGCDDQQQQDVCSSPLLKFVTEHPLLFSQWPVCDFEDSFA